MAKKNTLEIEQFQSLCDFDGEKFVAKSGQDYIDALTSIYPGKNPNDKPFTLDEIRKQPTLQEFNFSGLRDFEYVCDLVAEPLVLKGDSRFNEKILARNFQSEQAARDFKSSLGLVYLITCDLSGKEHIIKIGCSRTTFKDRLGSYNCGTVNSKVNASSTNFKILQSFVATRASYKLYLYHCGKAETYTWHDVTSVPFSSPVIFAVEDILVKKFQETFRQKPLANVQANATEA